MASLEGTQDGDKWARNYGLLGGLAEDLSPGRSLSESSEGPLTRGEGGAGIYRGFCHKGQAVGTSKDDCSLKKTRHLKLRNLALFYVWEDARVQAH